jgi:hypothetical protein
MTMPIKTFTHEELKKNGVQVSRNSFIKLNAQKVE